MSLGGQYIDSEVDLDDLVTTDELANEITTVIENNETLVESITEAINLDTKADAVVGAGGTGTKITYNTQGVVTGSANAGIGDITGLQDALDDKVGEDDLATAIEAALEDPTNTELITVIESAINIDDKADLQKTATVGNVATIGANGQYVDSGTTLDDLVTTTELTEEITTVIENTTTNTELIEAIADAINLDGKEDKIIGGADAGKVLTATATGWEWAAKTTDTYTPETFTP